jgi:hypothetical protein
MVLLVDCHESLAFAIQKKCPVDLVAPLALDWRRRQEGARPMCRHDSLHDKAIVRERALATKQAGCSLSPTTPTQPKNGKKRRRLQFDKEVQRTWRRQAYSNIERLCQTRQGHHQAGGVGGEHNGPSAESRGACAIKQPHHDLELPTNGVPNKGRYEKSKKRWSL